MMISEKRHEIMLPLSRRPAIRIITHADALPVFHMGFEVLIMEKQERSPF
jgi:hypothetical protein